MSGRLTDGSKFVTCIPQLCLLLTGFSLTGLFFHSANEDWSERPDVTTTEVMSRPISELLFPTVTVCRDVDVPVDPMVAIAR